jgi:transcription elongation factor Elf1
MAAKKPLTPVKPSGMELVFFYTCPFCGQNVPMASPVKPGLAQCGGCRGRFPVVPVDERTVQFFKLMTAGGKAAVDPDFV